MTGYPEATHPESSTSELTVLDPTRQNRRAEKPIGMCRRSLALQAPKGRPLHPHPAAAAAPPSAPYRPVFHLFFTGDLKGGSVRSTIAKTT